MTTCTLDELVGQGKSIQMGDKTYGDWLVIDNYPSVGLPLTPRLGPDVDIQQILSRVIVVPTEVDPLRAVLAGLAGVFLLRRSARRPSDTAG